MKVKSLIPYLIYLLGLVALLVTVQEPKQILKAKPMSPTPISTPANSR